MLVQLDWDYPSQVFVNVDCVSSMIGCSYVTCSLTNKSLAMFAVKDHTKSRTSMVEADKKIGEVQRGHAQDERRTKQGSKKKCV